MNQRLIHGALAVSVLFNVFFLGGYLHARTGFFGPATPRDVTDAVRDELDLDSTQSALFADLRRGGLEDAQVYEDSIALVRQELAAEWNREARDLDRLGEIINREVELRRQWKLSEASRLIDFVEALTPQQRRTLSTKVNRAAEQRARHEELLRRFDANGDGRLDRQERTGAKEFMRARQADRERRWRDKRDGLDRGDGARGAPDDAARQRRLRRQMLEHFDVDGDGRLGPEEQRALREWMHGRGGGDRP